MKYKTVTEEIYEEGIAVGVAEGVAKIMRNMLNKGFTDEQIIIATEQSPETIAAFRQKLGMTH